MRLGRLQYSVTKMCLRRVQYSVKRRVYDASNQHIVKHMCSGRLTYSVKNICFRRLQYLVKTCL